jgi:hypothetical protein
VLLSGLPHPACPFFEGLSALPLKYPGLCSRLFSSLASWTDPQVHDEYISLRFFLSLESSLFQDFLSDLALYQEVNSPLLSELWDWIPTTIEMMKGVKLVYKISWGVTAEFRGDLRLWSRNSEAVDLNDAVSSVCWKEEPCWGRADSVLFAAFSFGSSSIMHQYQAALV